MLSYSAPATSISTKGHTIPRPFFGRCLAPSTCEAGRQRWGDDCLPAPNILTAEAWGANQGGKCAMEAVRPLLGPEGAAHQAPHCSLQSKLLAAKTRAKCHAYFVVHFL